MVNGTPGVAGAGRAAVDVPSSDAVMLPPPTTAGAGVGAGRAAAGVPSSDSVMLPPPTTAGAGVGAGRAAADVPSSDAVMLPPPMIAGWGFAAMLPGPPIDDNKSTAGLTIAPPTVATGPVAAGDGLRPVEIAPAIAEAATAVPACVQARQSRTQCARCTVARTTRIDVIGALTCAAVISSTTNMRRSSGSAAV